jgi:hypothetical protein
MVNASSLTFSNITINSIFSLNDTLFSRYTLDQIKNNIVSSTNISTFIDDVSLSNVSITNINSEISSIHNSLNNLSTVNTSVNNLISDVTSHDTSLNDIITSINSFVSDLNNLSTVNTSVNNLISDVTSHDTSLNDIITSITNIQTKTDLIDLSGSTEFTFGDANSSVHIGGDIIFERGCHSTWNTSGIIPYSTQLGSYYYTNTVQSVNKNSSGSIYAFSPTNSAVNVSMETLPVGLYIVAVNGLIESYSGYDGTVSFTLGYATSTSLPMTQGNTNTTRTILIQDNGGELFTAPASKILPISATGIVNITTTGQYLAAYGSLALSGTITTGSVDLRLRSAYVAKIA